ncbi:hypothetical protein MKD41_02495 [Lutibacter sp. A64]|uniref:hypothetical protein n=1 Tax=Lutibacter sp. A64 TaxID=2918526 RepID=UPI001F06CB19|nr:hypothetical protein [Lutibacter sp. A64]UMB54359.1 hypothetical protein MKD41_02495 [Lutibacter sp. A64]
MKEYSILVNTCDKFEDCWNPFFKLWTVYWPDCKGKLYLNTEHKNYEFKGLDIVPLKVCKNNNFPKSERATWSQCLKWALEAMDTDIVLYMQEDYFLKDSVKNKEVEYYVNLMQNNTVIKCIHLTDQSVIAEGRSNYKNLDTVKYKQRYRVSCQAALWRKSELLELIRVNEDAWEFEEFGSMRSAVLQNDYYVVDRNYVKLNEYEIIPYIFTGIIQGRWYEEVIPLFKEHKIKVDFSKRGFVKDAPKKPFFKRVKYRLNKIPKVIRNYKELKRLKNE